LLAKVYKTSEDLSKILIKTFVKMNKCWLLL